MAQEITKCPFSMADLPMQADRTAGWGALTELGSVVSIDGIVMLTDKAAVDQALKNPLIFSSAHAFDQLGSPVPLVPIAIDPPDHRRYRRILDPFFAPRKLDAIEDQLRARLNERLDALVGRSQIEIMSELAVPYPAEVFLDIFGLPAEDRDMLIEWKDALLQASQLGASTIGSSGEDAAKGLLEYLQRFVRERRGAADGGADLMTRLLSLTGTNELTDDEVIGLGYLFVLAGLDTVTATIGFTLYHLANHPEIRHAMIADPSMRSTVFEEVLRLELPAPFSPRITQADVEVQGVLIPAGTPVVANLACANRDPSVRANPDELDLDRDDYHHHSFGGGIHRCLGSHLARLEMRLILEEFHNRFPDYHVAPGSEPEIRWPWSTLHFGALTLEID